MSESERRPSESEEKEGSERGRRGAYEAPDTLLPGAMRRRRRREKDAEDPGLPVEPEAHEEA